MSGPHYDYPPPRTLQAALGPPARAPYRLRPPHTKSPPHPHKYNYGIKKPQKMYPLRRPPLGPMMPPIGKYKQSYAGPNPGPVRPPGLRLPGSEYASAVPHPAPGNHVPVRPAGPTQPPAEDTMTLGQTNLIGSRVVHSHMTLPAGAAPSLPPSEQIILGRPVHAPHPLDQQMSSSRLHTKSDVFRLTPAAPPAVHAEPETFPSDAPAAVNTGFKPETIVVESGFRPIIREPLMDRTADRREDAGDVDAAPGSDEPDYADAPQHINHAYPADTITQSFEPMFVPSPPDAPATAQVFPPNHATEDRPHPVYVPRPSALFSPQNLAREPPPLAPAGSSPPLYLPPAPHTFTAYDGKTVSADTLTETHADAELFPAGSESLLKTPQFGPFKGDIPTDIADVVVALPGGNAENKLNDTRTTKLRLVNSFHELDPDYLDELKAEASEVHEIRTKAERGDRGDENIGTDQPQDDADEEVRRKRDVTSPLNTNTLNHVQLEVGTNSATLKHHRLASHV